METAGENPVKTGSGGCGGERASTTNTGPDACNGGHTVTEPEKEPGLFKDGYGVEIQGYDHVLHGDIEGVAFIPRDSKYRMRLFNSNDHTCMVEIELEGISIGQFLLHPFSKCDLERPVDRPLGFMYNVPLPAEKAEDDKNAKKPRSIKQIERDRTRIKFIFKPEVGGRVIQLDVNAAPGAGEPDKTQRLELLQDTSVQDLFCDVRRDFGEWVMAPTCALMHWTTAEYDSPVEDVLQSDAQTELRVCKRRETPLRKMTLVPVNTVEIEVEGDEECLVLARTTLPTVGGVEDAVRGKITTRDEIEEKVDKSEEKLYFLSSTGRFICSTDWAQPHTCILHLFHKDEILSHPGKLRMKVTSQKPDDLYTLFARLTGGGVHQMQVSGDSTVREMRLQLEALGGPWGDDPSWLFGGTLMESGHTLQHYGLIDKAVVDIVPRIQDKGHSKSLQMKDPISVEMETRINTSELIRRETVAGTKQRNSAANRSKHKPQRGATVLKGRIKQQFVEVDPIAVDSRFFVVFELGVLPKEHEDQIVTSFKEPQNVQSKNACIIL